MNQLKDYFYYTRSERNGVLVLLTLIGLMLCYPYVFDYFNEPDPPTDFSEWRAEIAAFEAGLGAPLDVDPQEEIHWVRPAYVKNPAEERPLKPISFDPNTVSREALEAMGLPERTINSWVNYRDKGGTFKYQESIGKLYTLKPEHYKQLYPYVTLPSEKLAKQKSEAIPNTTVSNTSAKPLPPAFDFDPNTVSEVELKALGVPERAIKGWLNYRAKGGTFRDKAAVQRIYNLPDSVYQHLAVHIQITETPRPKWKSTKRVYKTIEINAATEEDFQQFRGIGPSYARRLVQRGKDLGGYISIEQVGELYKLPDSTFQHIKPFLTCTPQVYQKININEASEARLKAHPYLRWFHAKAIVAHRERKGPWSSVDLLQILSEFDDGKGTFEKIRPYLTVN